MCVIIIKPRLATMSDMDLKNCYDNNPHGMGWMYAKGGRVIADKFIPENYTEFKDVWDQLSDVDAVVHLRWMTAGDLTEAQCHPFRVLKENAVHQDLFFMHNGTFKIDASEGESDTIAFKSTILKPILQRDPELIHKDKFIKMLEGMDTWSRMCFLSGDGRITTTRTSSWVRRGNGCLLSNNYSTTAGHRAPDIWKTSGYGGWGAGETCGATTTHTKTVVSNIVPFIEGPAGKVKEAPIDKELTDLLASLSTADIEEWLKSDRDDAIQTLLSSYDQNDLKEYMCTVGAHYSDSRSITEDDVDFFIEYFKLETLAFIQGSTY